MTWPFAWWRRMFGRPEPKPADPPAAPDRSGRELRHFVAGLQSAVACKSAAAHAEIDAAEAQLAMARASSDRGRSAGPERRGGQDA